MQKKVKFSQKVRFSSPYLIAAWPGMGQVAYLAVQHLIKHLKAQEFCSLDASEYFYSSGVEINNGIANITSVPSNKFYYWKDKEKDLELIIFLGQVQPDLNKGVEYVDFILDTCLKVCREIKGVFTFAAMPTTIEHTHKPQVFAAATDRAFLPRLKNANIEVLMKSHISGMNGLFLGVAKERKIDGICILAQVPLYTVQIDNPWAAAEILAKFSQLINLKIDIVKLEKEAEQIEAQINKFVEYFKESLQPLDSEDQPISQDELERIKHALAQYTKLPESAKSSIEKLFDEAKVDLDKAKELKIELDKWNIYSEYEDRFLDLFKRNQEQDN